MQSLRQFQESRLIVYRKEGCKLKSLDGQQQHCCLEIPIGVVILSLRRAGFKLLTVNLPTMPRIDRHRNVPIIVDPGWIKAATSTNSLPLDVGSDVGIGFCLLTSNFDVELHVLDEDAVGNHCLKSFGQ